MKLKKISYFLFLFAPLLAGCATEDPAADERDGDRVQVSLRLGIDTQADTRADYAGRELFSQQALQQVNNLRLYVFDGADGTAQLKEIIPIPDFNNDKAVGNEEHIYKFDPRLKGGHTYQFLAVGEEEKPTHTDLTSPTYSSPTYSFTTKAGGALVLGTEQPDGTLTGGTTLAEMLISLKTEDTKAAEVFAGLSIPYEIDFNRQTLSATVTLTRVTAGVLGYFTNIPHTILMSENKEDIETVDAVVVRLTGKGLSTTLADKTVNTQTPQTAGDYYDILRIEMAGAAYDEVKNIYTREAVTTGITTRADSWLAGGFVLPFDRTAGEPTFRVLLMHYVIDEATGQKTGEKILKSYPVICKASDASDRTHIGADLKEIDVMANQLYSLGIKKENSNPKSAVEPEATPMVDDPIDLTRDKILTLRVDANWAVVHDLVLGPEEEL